MADVQADMVAATSDAAAFTELLEETMTEVFEEKAALEPEKFTEELKAEAEAVAAAIEVVEYVVVEIEVEVPAPAPVENATPEEDAGASVVEEEVAEDDDEIYMNLGGSAGQGKYGGVATALSLAAAAEGFSVL